MYESVTLFDPSCHLLLSGFSPCFYFLFLFLATLISSMRILNIVKASFGH